MSITVKLVSGIQKQVDVPDLNITVLHLKDLVAPAVDISADEQRVVLRGRILKDSDVLSAVGLEHGNAIHIVRSRKKEVEQPAVTQPPASNTQSAMEAGGSSQATATTNPYSVLSGMQGFPFGGGIPGVGSGVDGMGGAGMGTDMNFSPADVLQIVGNPQLMQQVQDAARDPVFMQEIARMHPGLSRMSPEGVEAVSSILQNPEMLRHASRIMTERLRQEGGTGAMGGFPMGGLPMGTPAGGMGFNPAAFAVPSPSGDPRTIYRDQLVQLREMGFPNEDANIVALQQSQGNLIFAVERLLGA